MQLRLAPILAGFFLAQLLASGDALAADLVGATFVQRGGHFAAASATQLSSTATTPRYSGTGATAGAPQPVGFTGSSSSLRTLASGFWPLVAGSFPQLDTDADGVPAYVDDDDDGDGLADAVETGTGVFVSASDTGTDPVLADSDGDGFSDGVEVAAGSDPNLAASIPNPLAVPALVGPGLVALVVLLSFIGLVALEPRSRGSA